MLTEAQVEIMVGKLKIRRVKAEESRKFSLVGMLDSVIHYLNLVLEK